VPLAINLNDNDFELLKEFEALEIQPNDVEYCQPEVN